MIKMSNQMRFRNIIGNKFRYQFIQVFKYEYKLQNIQIQMDTIQRVDQLVKQNIIKYKQQKYQEQYQKELQEFERRRKKDALRSYTQIIKEGNKKAVQKAKQKNKKTRKSKNRTVAVQKQAEIIEDNGQNKKNKLNENQIKKIQAAIESRAQRIIQQKQLEKLDRCLQQQKKKTKLFQLNQRCRKIAKSSTKISAPSAVIPEERRKILQQFEKKAMQEVEELDNIIGQIISGKAVVNKNPQKQPRYTGTKSSKVIKSVQINQDAFNTYEVKPSSPFKNRGTMEERIKIQKRQGRNLEQNRNQSKLDIQNIIFVGSTEELLSLEYIPI